MDIDIGEAVVESSAPITRNYHLIPVLRRIMGRLIKTREGRIAY
jgi:hypothetical protein